MAFQSVDKTGVGSDVAFGYWFGPSGRDCNGRFVKRGSELECDLSHEIYRTGLAARARKFWAQYAGLA